MIDAEDITRRLWRIDSGGEELGNDVALRSDGTIHGAESLKGYRWRIDRNVLSIVNENGDLNIMAPSMGQQGELLFEELPIVHHEEVYRGLVARETCRALVKPEDFSIRLVPITSAIITQHTWRFLRVDGPIYAVAMQMLPGGEMLGHDCEPERRWVIVDGDFAFTNTEGELTTRFYRLLERNGRYLLCGRPVHGYRDFPPSHLLESERRYSVNIAAPFHMELSLDEPSRPVIVTLNGRGSLFDGNSTQFDFYGLPKIMKTNSIRIAEREGRVAWYVDKSVQIMAHLRNTVNLGYGPIILCGSSAGGYGAQLFAELLAAERPDLPFASVSVNPQTGVQPIHTSALLAAGLQRYMPPSISPDALSAADCEITEIADLIRRRSSHNVSHYVLYDESNPAEAYYTGLIEGLPGVELMRFDVGGNHVQGLTHIGRSDEFRQVVRQLVEGAP